VSVTQAVSVVGVAGWPVTVGVAEMGVVNTLRCQPARSRHCAVQVHMFTLHTGAMWPRLGVL